MSGRRTLTQGCFDPLLGSCLCSRYLPSVEERFVILSSLIAVSDNVFCSGVHAIIIDPEQ
jgi:hypothetical protein